MSSMNSNSPSYIPPPPSYIPPPPLQSSGLNQVGSHQINQGGNINAERLPKQETVQMETAAHPEKIQKDSGNFFKTSLASLMENKGDLTAISLAQAAVTMSPLSLSAALMGKLGAKVIKETGMATVSEKEFAKAGLLVGTLGLIGIASSLYHMKDSSKSNSAEKSPPQLREKFEGRNDTEKKLIRRIDDLRNYAQQGTYNKNEVKDKQKSIVGEIKQNRGTEIDKDLAKEALKEVKKAKQDVKLAPEKQKELLTNTANNHQRVLDRSVDFNNYVLILSDHLDDESKAKLGNLSEIIRQEKILKNNLNNLINDPNTTLAEKLDQIQKFKGAANNEANLKTLDILKEALSKNRSPQEINEIKAHINILKKYLDLETKGKVEEYTTADEWAHFQTEEQVLTLSKVTAYMGLMGFTSP